MTRITPIGDHVVVQAETADEKSQGGLYIPDTAREKPQRGRVLAAGPGRTENGVRLGMSVEEGDTVLYGKYAGTELKLGGEDVLVMRESDLFGIVEA